MAVNSIGSNIDVAGWAKVSEVKQPSGAYTAEYRGDMSSLDLALAYIKGAESIPYDNIDASIDPASGIATVRINASALTADADVKIPANQTKQPTCTIQGTMLAPQLHQHPTWTADANNALTLQAIQATEYCLKNYGQVTDGDLSGESEIAKLYARWKSFGIDTYIAPSYTMTLTFFLDAKQKSAVNNYIKTAGKAWKFETVTSLLPSALRPASFDVPAWLAQAPTIQYTSEGITVSQQYVGADKFPSFYDAEDASLVYDPPALPETYWRNSKYKQVTSGVTTTEEGAE